MNGNLLTVPPQVPLPTQPNDVYELAESERDALIISATKFG